MLSACLSNLKSFVPMMSWLIWEHTKGRTRPCSDAESGITSAHSKSEDSLDDNRFIMAIFLGWLAKQFPILFAYINSRSKFNVN